MPTLKLSSPGIISEEPETIHIDEYQRMSMTEKSLVIQPIIAATVVFIAFIVAPHVTKETMGFVYKVTILSWVFAGFSCSATFMAAWMKRRRVHGYYLIDKNDLDKFVLNQNLLVSNHDCLRDTTVHKASKDKTAPMNYLNERIKTLECYVNICIAVSRIIMTLSGVRLKQVFHEDMSAAKGLSEEWAYELEQEEDIVIRAIDATYMVRSSVAFSLRHGFISRVFESILSRKGCTKKLCSCGETKSRCNDGNNSAGNKTKISKYF